MREIFHAWRQLNPSGKLGEIVYMQQEISAMQDSKQKTAEGIEHLVGTEVQGAVRSVISAGSAS